MAGLGATSIHSDPIKQASASTLGTCDQLRRYERRRAAVMQPSMGRAASTPASIRLCENTDNLDAAAAAPSTAADASLPVELSNAFANRGTCCACSTDGNAGMLMTGGADGTTSAPATLPPTVALCMEPCPWGKCSTGASSGLAPCSIGGKGATFVREVAGSVPEAVSAATVDVWSSADEVWLLTSSVACVLVIGGCVLALELVELGGLVNVVELVKVVVGAGVVVLVDVAVVVADNSRSCISDTTKLAVFTSHRGAPSQADWSNQCVSPDHNVTAITKPACIALTVWATSLSGTPEAGGYSEAGVPQDGFQP